MAASWLRNQTQSRLGSCEEKLFADRMVYGNPRTLVGRILKRVEVA
jgi:hypothetical protein